MQINENELNNAVKKWWQSINPDQKKNTLLNNAPSKYRAELRRCQRADMALLTPGFRALWFGLPENITKHPTEELLECWGTISILLAYVKTATEHSLAYSAGVKKDGEKKSIVSELRFAKLQQAKTPDDFLRRARRILSQLNGNVSPIRLTQDIRKWFGEYYQDTPERREQRIAIRWAMDYYEAASK